MKGNNKWMTIENISVQYTHEVPHVSKEKSKKHLGLLIGTLALLLISVICFIKYKPYYDAWYEQRLETTLGLIINYSLLGLFIFQLFFIAYNTYLFLKYRPTPAVTDDALPKCTVIIPAYNEGRLVYSTLQSIVESDYPSDKLEIWAIDDGSQDDTWMWIERARIELGAVIHTHRQPQNMGKRQALYYGFHQGSGEVFITIDSDSIIEKDTLRHMVSPFVQDQQCGAVAGNVKVLNKEEGFIPRMLNVSFVFSFEFIRSAQSALGFVLCTPGALSAYRKKAVMPILEEWVHQQFAGAEATIGEDRAMTNMILAQGYDVTFQKNAVVYTNTPINFKTLHKMFTRWSRSNVRESLMMNKFIFKNFRPQNKLGARIIYFNQWLNILMAIPLVILMLVFIFSDPLLYICAGLSGIFIFSSIQMLFYAMRNKVTDALWAYPYSIFYMFALWWIVPYSILTVKNGGWLTR